MKCNQCQTEMVGDCQVRVEGDLSGIKISKKGKGFFKKVTAKTKAAVCPKCGFLSFYVEDYKDFK
jgi:ssDNA-binding Zn-finger/Zn-ribbon topoisomerase 1